MLRIGRWKLASVQDGTFADLKREHTELLASLAADCGIAASEVAFSPNSTLPVPDRGRRLYFAPFEDEPGYSYNGRVPSEEPLENIEGYEAIYGWASKRVRIRPVRGEEPRTG